MIELTAADGHRFAAYAAGPKDAKRALVVVQEIFGVNNNIRRICDAFAAEGYAVVAPALFDRAARGTELGYTPEDVQRGRTLKGQVPEIGQMLDVEAAAAALPKGATRGIIGYCWGGTVAWWGATRSKSFAAAVGWYGGGIAGTRTETPNCPVQLHFGEIDHAIPLTDIEAIRAAQPAVEIFVYKGAGHGFGCDERDSYSAPDQQVAQTRSLAFLAKHLG
jgi:carboxymethylenebutenolidase